MPSATTATPAAAAVPNNSHRGSKAFGTNPDSRLWQPLKLGPYTLEHRVVLCPLTRLRSPSGTPTPLVAEYYAQRSSPGGLLISEATFIAPEAGGYRNAPGIYSEEQIEAWKKVTDAVHEKGGVFFCQLWALGRANHGGDPEKVPEIVSASTTPLSDAPEAVPRELTKEDIKRYLNHYAHAARSAIKAGFDGCEIHGAHGYLLDQFLQASSNNTRSDEYDSSSLENRARFMLEAIQAVANEIGEERTAIRLSPFSAFQDMAQEKDPYETWGYVCREIKQRFPRLAYVSFTDPRLPIEAGGRLGGKEFSSDPFRAIFRGVDPSTVSRSADEPNFNTTRFPEPTEEHPTVFLSAGGYAASDAEEVSERTGDVCGYGRMFIANPDLPHRLKNGLELNPYDRSTFYGEGAEGYTTYPFANEKTKKFVPPTETEENSKL